MQDTFARATHSAVGQARRAKIEYLVYNVISAIDFLLLMPNHIQNKKIVKNQYQAKLKYLNNFKLKSIIK